MKYYVVVGVGEYVMDWENVRDEWETTKITLKDLAAKHDIKLGTLKSRKSREGWSRGATKKDATKSKKVATPKKPHRAPKGNKYAVGNRGNPNPKPYFTKQNTEAMTHGFFRTIFPDDEETLAIVDAIQEKGPVDMLWENIVIKYTAIARAQKLMYVEDQDDITKEIKKEKLTTFGGEDGGTAEETEYEIQFAWDKHATFLTAQSRAMSELRGLIKDFIQLSGQDDYRRAQLDKMQHDMKVTQEKLDLDKAKANIDDGQYEDDGFIEALGDAVEVWEDDNDDGTTEET